MTDPAGQREWWTDGRSAVDTGGVVRIGQTTFVEWDREQGGRCRAEQTYVEIERPVRLVMKETVHEPDVPPYECTLTMTFTDENGKTRYTLHHEGFPTLEERDRHEGGTRIFCERLAKYLVGQRVV
jgi:uncharacterized protein YndB with AHSA1/START domain